VSENENNKFTFREIVFYLILFLIIFSMFAYSDKSSEPAFRINQFDKAKICQQYISLIMGKSSSTQIYSSHQKSDSMSDFFKVFYTRGNGVKWEYICSLDHKNEILTWAPLFSSNSEFDIQHRRQNGGDPLGRWRYEDEGSYKLRINNAQKQAIIETPNMGIRTISLGTVSSVSGTPKKITQSQTSPYVIPSCNADNVKKTLGNTISKIHKQVLSNKNSLELGQETYREDVEKIGIQRDCMYEAIFSDPTTTRKYKITLPYLVKFDRQKLSVKEVLDKATMFYQ